MAHLLGAENIGIAFGTRTVLEGLSLGVDEGDRIGLVGRNGDGVLTVGGLDAAELAATHGTPLFVLDEEDFRARAVAFRDAFADASQVTAVWVYFQTSAWERPFDAFTARFLPDEGDIPAGDPERRRIVEVEGLSGDAAHNLALPRSLRLALPGLVPPVVCP